MKHQHGHPPEDELLTAIKSLLDESKQTFIIIDALDECPKNEDEREHLCNILKEIHNWATPNLHVLVTSRKEVDLDTALSPIVTLGPISITDNNVSKSDIRKYVKTRLATDDELVGYPAELKDKVESTLVERAQGM